MWIRSGTCQVVEQFAQSCLVGRIPGVNPFLQDVKSSNPGEGGRPSDCTELRFTAESGGVRARWIFRAEWRVPRVHWDVWIHGRWPAYLLGSQRAELQECGFL